MSYTHLTKTELIFIEEYHSFGLKGRQIADKLQRGHETIYRIIRKLKQGQTAIEIYLEYKQNKQNCGRNQLNYLRKKLITSMKN